MAHKLIWSVHLASQWWDALPSFRFVNAIKNGICLFSVEANIFRYAEGAFVFRFYLLGFGVNVRIERWKK